MDKMQPIMTIDNAGNKCWKLRDKYHRVDGPAVILANGSTQWMVNNKTHRTDGPAVILANGSTQWMVNNKTHRTDGPAIEWENGKKGWFIHGTPLSFDEWIDQNQTLTEEEKVMYKLQYG
jgi:outer membrane lipoprotein-sorting protein